MNELHPLGKLIQAAQDREGWSTRDLERVAERKGYSMRHSNFSRLKIEPVVAIKATQIRVLASVLGVSEEAVAIAAIASIGAEIDAHASTLEDSLRLSTDLINRDQRLVLALVSAMRNEESGSDGQLHEEQRAARAGNKRARTLRALAPEGDLGAGQKTEPDGSIVEFHGAEAEKYPAPPIEHLAAHPKVKTTRERLDEQTGEQTGERDN